MLPAAGGLVTVVLNPTFRAPGFVNELSQATLAELASAGAISSYTLHGQPGGYTLIVRYGMSESVLVAKRGGPRLFAKVETAFDWLRSLGVAQVEVRISDYAPSPRPYRKGRPAAIAALDQLQGKTPKRRGAKVAVMPSAKAQLPLPGVVRGRRVPAASS